MSTASMSASAISVRKSSNVVAPTARAALAGRWHDVGDRGDAIRAACARVAAQVLVRDPAGADPTGACRVPTIGSFGRG